METIDRTYIDGAWRLTGGGPRLQVVDANNEDVIAEVCAGTEHDVNRAARAAAAAFPAWSAIPVSERAGALVAVADGLSERTAELATTIAREVGMPYELSKAIQVGLAEAVYRDMAAVAMAYPWEERIGTSLVVREPVGVVGAITPWNYPLYQCSLKVAAALAAGCTVVLKPSEVAPLDAFALTEIIDGVGLPAGVFNLVPGTGPVVGEAIASHPAVDMVTFTGSTPAGKRVMALAAGTVKKVALELGGKSATIILDDADLEVAVASAMFGCFLNSGQTCSALTRMIVPRSKLPQIERLAVESATGYAPGDAFDDSTLLGPLASDFQRDRVRRFIDAGMKEGAKLLTGGTEAPEGLERGYFVLPTVFSEVTPDMTIAREEIFGPVLAILPYETEEEAITIANDSSYGLSGAVWSGDRKRAERIARRLRSGQVDVNGGPFNPIAPFGGYKQSGIGRERGLLGFEEFLEVKSLQLPAEP